MPPRSDGVWIRPIDVRWHSDEVWALFGYQRCFTDCSMVGGVNVVNVVDGTRRELSQCGFRPSCIDWLPNDVDVSRLPIAQNQSVLPAPISYDFAVETDLLVDRSELNPLETCDPLTDKKVHILDPKTQQTIFILPINPVPNCTDGWNPHPTNFALSHDGKIFAWRNTLFDAHTGAMLAFVNANGWELAFSADDTQLSMRSVNARMVWDVQELLGTGKRMKLLAEYFQRSK